MLQEYASGEESLRTKIRTTPTAILMTLGDLFNELGIKPEKQDEIVAALRKDGLASIDIKVQPNQASYLSLTKKQYQRKLHPPQVNKLVKAAQSGQYEPGQFKIGFVKPRDGRYRNQFVSITDGQHRVEMIRKSGIAQMATITISAYNSEDDMKRAALRTDAHRKRSATDQASIMEIDLGVQVNETANKVLTPAVTKLIGWRVLREVNDHIGKYVESAVTGDDRLDIINFMQGRIQEYFSTIKYGSRILGEDTTEKRTGRLDNLREIPVVAMGMATFFRNNNVAEKFWRAILMNEALPKSPEAALWDFINGNWHKDTKEKKRLGELGTGANDQRRLALAVKLAWEAKLANRKINNPTKLKDEVYATFDEAKESGHPVDLSL